VAIESTDPVELAPRVEVPLRNRHCFDEATDGPQGRDAEKGGLCDGRRRLEVAEVMVREEQIEGSRTFLEVLQLLPRLRLAAMGDDKDGPSLGRFGRAHRVVDIAAI